MAHRNPAPCPQPNARSDPSGAGLEIQFQNQSATPNALTEQRGAVAAVAVQGPRSGGRDMNMWPFRGSAVRKAPIRRGILGRRNAADRGTGRRDRGRHKLHGGRRSRCWLPEPCPGLGRGPEGAAWVQQAVSPGVLAQMGRDLVRAGQTMHVIRMDGMGRVRLIPASSWHWEGSHDPASWTVRVTAYGPSTSTTWHLPGAGVVFVRWGGTPGVPYVGTGPLSWASAPRRGSKAKRSGPLPMKRAGRLPTWCRIPQDGGDGDGEDDVRSTALKADIRTARGKALLLETVAGGWGEGRAAAPQTRLERAETRAACRRIAW